MTQPGLKAEQALPQPEYFANPTGEVIALRFDVQNLLESEIGLDWSQQLSDVIEAGSLNLRQPDGHPTNREKGTVANLGLVTAKGAELAAQVPGLWTLYLGDFKSLMSQAIPEGADPMAVYDNPEAALEGYSQRPVRVAGSDELQHRMEGHVDQRYTAVLVIEAPSEETDGGLLVISNDATAESPEEIERDAVFIKHVPGTLVCFSMGRTYPHLTQEVTNPAARRIVVSLNYPTVNEPPEAANELLQHIAGI